MCSIFGVIGGAGKDLITNSHKMRHRGPDGSGFYSDSEDRFSFLHNRLSFLDLSSGGAQPIVTDKSAIVFNGEIYNYKDLSDTYFPNENFSGDTRLLQRLIEKEGIRKALSLVQGMFALVFFDFSNETAYMARDGHGEKPLFYLQNKTMIYFGSEVKSLISYSDKEIDELSLLSYIQYGFVNVGSRTIYKNIKPHYNCFVLQNIQMYIRHVQVFHFHFRNEPI